jgi:tRNA(His) 5'-end guanylyltransferase
MEKSSLGDRMKNYEAVSKSKLMGRTPVIIRIDGKAFHTYTRGMPKPFYFPLHGSFLRAAVESFGHISTAVLAYTQSDEISFLLKDWSKLESQQYFGGGIQKIASVAASVFTAHFNKCFEYPIDEAGYINASPAIFDARVFNIPKEEVVNYFIWRQQDATRNSINALGQSHFTHRQLQGKNVSQVQDMLMSERSVNWNDIDTWAKRGSCVQRIDGSGVASDIQIPIFTQDRGYIEKFLSADEECNEKGP